MTSTKIYLISTSLRLRSVPPGFGVLVLLQELRGILRRKLTRSGSLRGVTQEEAVGTIAKLTRLSEFHRSVGVPHSELPFHVPMTSRAVLVAEAAE